MLSGWVGFRISISILSTLWKKGKEREFKNHCAFPNGINLNFVVAYIFKITYCKLSPWNLKTVL